MAGGPRRVLQMVSARLRTGGAKDQGKRTPAGNKLPPVVHRSLAPKALKPGRLVIVGDVHGCNDELDALVQKLGFRPGHDNLLFVGDLVNKGPGSVEVLDAFLRLGALGVRGNHDDSSLHRWHKWKQEGKELARKHAWVADMQAKHVEVLESLPFTLSLPSYGIVIVHAGLFPSTPLEQQDLWAMYKMCSVAPTGSGDDVTGGQPGVGKEWLALEKAKQGGQAVATAWTGPSHMFFGHDAKRGLQLAPHATGLDSGAVYGRTLTAAVVPPLQQLLDGSAGSGRLPHKLSAGLPVTWEDLGVEVVSVASARAYEQPSSAAPAALAATDPPAE